MSLSIVQSIPLITLAGPPNSGKTTLFNFLSGQNYKTVNYPGATVEYSISCFQTKFGLTANLLDSPGIVSLTPSSPDEKISIESLYAHPHLGTPDLIIATVDANQLSRHLLLARQLIESKFNVIIAITMADLLKKRGHELLVDELKKALGCEIVVVDGRTGSGIDILIAAIEKNIKTDHLKPEPLPYCCNLEIDRLIHSYNEIEIIERRVLREIPSNGDGAANLIKANKQLKILNQPETKSIKSHLPDKTTLNIDRYLLHRYWGLFFFFMIMAATFTSIFWLAAPFMNWIDALFGYLADLSLAAFGFSWFGDLIANGIISGAGSVLVFVPQILILFLILGLLEDTGYLARGAMLIDNPLSKIGLNGKSFVPMLSGFACAIPAILAARTIPNRRERLLTIFIIPLMSCSARLPVYALLIAFLIPADKPWLGGVSLAAIYIFSIVSSITIAGIANKLKNRIVKEEDNSSFILELPAYRKPQLKVVLINTYHSAKIYLKKAGPIILGFSIILWLLTYFPNVDPKIDTNNLSETEIIQLKNAERLSNSYAADLGKFIQPVMTPIGMDWRVGVSLIAAFAAREVFVSSLALIFKVTSDNETLQNSLLEAMHGAEIESTGKKLFTTSTIIGLIIFFVFALQCISTIAVSKKETGGWRIPILQLIAFTGTAYVLTFITVHGLRFLGVQ